MVILFVVATFLIQKETPFSSLAMFAIRDKKWHFVAFSFDAKRSTGYIVLDERVTHHNVSVPSKVLDPKAVPPIGTYDFAIGWNR